MAEEENVGGINIEASVSDAGVTTGLEKIKGQIQTAAEQLSASFVIHPTIGPIQQQTTQQAQRQAQQAQRAQQPAPITFRPGNLPTPAFAGRSSAAIEKINAELAKTGEILDELTGEPVPIASIQKATRATQDLATATGQVQQPTVTPTVDDAELKASLAALVPEIKTLAANLSEAFVITPTIAAPTEAQAPTAAPVQAPVVEPVVPEIVTPTAEPVTAQVAEPVVPTITQPTVAPVEAPVAEAVVQPVTEPAAPQAVTAPVVEPVVTPVVTPPTPPPVKAPVVEPVIPPIPPRRPPTAVGAASFGPEPSHRESVAAAAASRQQELLLSSAVKRADAATRREERAGLEPQTPTERTLIAALQTSSQIPRPLHQEEQQAQQPRTDQAQAPREEQFPQFNLQRYQAAFDSSLRAGASREDALRAASADQERYYNEQRAFLTTARRDQRQQPPPRPTGPTAGTQQPLGLPRTREEEAQFSPEAVAEARARADRQAEEFFARAGGPTTELGGAGARGGAGRGRALPRTEEDIDITAEQRLAQREAESVAAGRTLRTQESSLGGFIAGRRNLIKANVDLQAANEKVRISQRRLLDPEIQRDPIAKREATVELNDALHDQADALERIKSFSTPFAAARNLAGIAIAGAAFGLGLKAIDFGLSVVTPALESAVDQMSGFGITSSKVTSDLAKQTQAMGGNAAAVLATAEAQAGLSAASADALDNQLKLTTQIKAGAANAAAAGGLFRAGLGTNQQVPQGLLGGYGGIGGGALFAQQLGGGTGLAETIQSTFGDLSKQSRQQRGENAQRAAPNNPFAFRAGAYVQGTDPNAGLTTEQIAALAKDRITVESTYNEAAKRGATALGASEKAVVHFAQIQATATQTVAEQVAELQGLNLPDELKNTAKDSGEALYDASGNLVKSFDKAAKGLEQIGAGLSIPDVATSARIAIAQELQRERLGPGQAQALRLQQQFEQPAFQRATERQQQFALQVQQPAQQALQNLAQPLQPVGTGIAPATAQEQATIAAGQARSQEIQDQLNAGYERGRQILATTYQVPLQLLNQIASVGKEIAGLQAGISNEQAAYQTAQFNFQLRIARRTLADIGGLTGKNFGAGESYLGVLERQNLALSRQAQLLSFSLAQRQINFQQALAGFQTPGITPEERQANVKEAQIEADYAQKQLDIQRQMFGNQVQIVDIQNLREGADLAAQIGLLLQGRQLTIDAAQAQETIGLLQTQVAQLTAQAGTYLSKLDQQVASRISQINQYEATAGQAMYNIAYSTLDAVGILLTGLNKELGQFNVSHGIQDAPGEGVNAQAHASGVIGTATSKTGMIVGEAGSETVAVLRNARSLNLGNGTGGGDMIVNFGDVYVRDDSDIQKIVQAVMAAMGQRASLVGLRLNG